MCRSLSLYKQLAVKKRNRTNTLHCPSSNKRRRRRKYSRSCMAHTKTNMRIICLSALAVMATLLLSSDALGLLKPYFSIIAYIYRWHETCGNSRWNNFVYVAVCNAIRNCNENGGVACIHLCAVLNGYGAKAYCNGNNLCCCPPSNMDQLHTSASRTSDAAGTNETAPWWRFVVVSCFFWTCYVVIVSLARENHVWSAA